MSCACVRAVDAGDAIPAGADRHDAVPPPPLESVHQWRRKHYVFLQHGIWGHNSDLLAVREALLGQCETRASDTTGIHVDPETHEEIELITVISNVNTGKTHDGVKEGGENLFRLIEDTCEPGSFLSLIGHSLGGLYCRAALKLLAAQPSRYPYSDPSETVGSLGLVPVNYISFATPHLGLREMPAMVQFGAFVVSGKTGWDLLLRSDTLGEWLIDEDALRGLALCKRRIVYANVANDLMVGPWTSAISDGFPEEVSMRCRAHPKQPVEVRQEVLDKFRAYRASGIRMRGDASDTAVKRGPSLSSTGSRSSSKSTCDNRSKGGRFRSGNFSMSSSSSGVIWSDVGEGSLDESSESGEATGQEEPSKMKKNKKCMKNLTCEQLAKLRRMIRALETLEWTPLPCDWKYPLPTEKQLSSSDSLGSGSNVSEHDSIWERYLVYYRKPRIENPGNGAHLKIINIDVAKSGAGDSVLTHMASKRFLWSVADNNGDASPSTAQSGEKGSDRSKVSATTTSSSPVDKRMTKISL